MRRSRMRLLGVLAAATLLVVGCGGGTSAGSGADPGAGFDPTAIFRYGVPGMPTSFDPRRSAPLDPVFLDVVYESLIGRSPAGEIEPGLATEWTFSPDNRSLDLTLRTGVVFQDGEPFDSGAVVASLKALGASGAQASALSSIDHVEALGPDSVRITFTGPAGYMLNVLAGEAGIVVAPKALADPDLGTKPVGTGAFRLTGLQQGKVTFARFDRYWNDAKTTIGGIEMTVYPDEPTRLRAVVSGQTDGTTISSGQIKEAEGSGLTIVKGPQSTLNALLLNTSAPEFGNPLVRKALLYAIDRRTIGAQLYAGGCTPAVQPFSDAFWPNVPELNDVDRYHDVAKAKSLLAEAGLPNGLSFTLEHGPNTSYQNLAQALQAQLAEAGITVTVRQLDFSQMIESRRTGRFSATVSLLQAGRPDPSQFVADFYLPGGTYNPGNFAVDGLAQLLTQSRASSDVATRQPLTRQMFDEAFEAGPPVIPVCALDWVGAFREGVSGFEVPKLGDYSFATVKISN